MNNFNFHRIVILIIGVSLLSSFLFGCAVDKGKVYVKDGKSYGTTGGLFKSEWDDYYLRGLSYGEGEYWEDAARDFAVAIQKRDNDQRRARTYGMHFMDYFPHRELGIVYFQRKEYSKAILELEDSIESAPSAKGHYFLNKARAAKIEKNQLDTAPPELHLEGKSTQEITNTFTKIVKGVAKDDNFVAGIQIGGRQVMVELAERYKVFSEEVPLKEGDNIIHVIATDLAGKSTEKSLDIYCDRKGPQIEIEELTAKDGNVTIRGSATDDKGLVSLRINNTPWPITGKASGYNFKMIVPDGKITVVARDRAGNVTRAIVRENEFDLQKAASYPRLADLSSADLLTSGSMVVSDAPGPMFVSTAAEPVDTEPPYIRLEDLGPAQETYDDMVLLEGKVSDSSLLIYITVNGEPVLNRKGWRIYFSLLKKLKKGENEFRIVAADEHGNKIDKTIKITRKVQKIRQIGSRMSVAILPFEQKGESSNIGEIVHDQMIDSFLEQARFNIVERKKIDAILRELKLSSTELVNPDEAAKLGKIVAAQSMLAGSVIESPDSIEILGRLIDTETATVLASNDIFGEDKGLGSIDNLLDSLAFKFKKDFPLVEGILLEVRDDEVLIDIGKKKLIKPNVRLICYREGPPIKHPVTGRMLGSEPEILGKLKVEEVYDDFSKAAVLDHALDMIASDKVIVQ